MCEGLPEDLAFDMRMVMETMQEVSSDVRFGALEDAVMEFNVHTKSNFDVEKTAKHFLEKDTSQNYARRIS
jgi:hypothetical protein